MRVRPPLSRPWRASRTPDLVAESGDPRLIVMTDLGEGTHLADALLGADADRATETLSGWATALAGLHRAGRDTRAAFGAGVVARAAGLPESGVELDYVPGRPSRPLELRRADGRGLVPDDPAAAALPADRGRDRCSVRARPLDGGGRARPPRSRPARGPRAKAPIRRYERRRPGDLVHLDIKRLARFDKPGHRVTGSRVGQNSKVGFEYVHVCIDDHSRAAYVEVLDDETGDTCARFLARAVVWFAQQGITVRRVMTDNRVGYRSHLFRHAWQALGLRHLLTRPYTPQTIDSRAVDPVPQGTARQATEGRTVHQDHAPGLGLCRPLWLLRQPQPPAAEVAQALQPTPPAQRHRRPATRLQAHNTGEQPPWITQLAQGVASRPPIACSSPLVSGSAAKKFQPTKAAITTSTKRAKTVCLSFMRASVAATRARG